MSKWKDESNIDKFSVSFMISGKERKGALVRGAELFL